MHVVSLSGVTRTYEGHTVFSPVSFGLTNAEHVGVVGRNGAGKSTLLRLAAGVEQPDAGEVVFNTDAKVTYLPQLLELDESRTVAEVVGHGTDPTVRGHEVEAMLERLGLTPTTVVGGLSGGQKRRAALARALLPDSDLLVLDEPTNHLDVSTIDWLEQHLHERNAGLLLVTHDRYFLERLTNRMLELEAGEMYWHEGSYSAVLEARRERAEQAARAERTRRNLLRKEIAWLQRGPRARTSKPKFRREQVQQLREAAPGPEEAQLQLGTGRRRLGTDVVDLEDVTLAFGDHVVLRGVDLALRPGQRLGVVGPNGAGKTTLLEVLAGVREPSAGTRRMGSTVEVGYYRQEAATAPSSTRVLDTIEAIAAWIPLADGRRLSASALAERFLFDDRLQQAAVDRLSGGERRRLALLHTLVRAPNVLVLDEPTNDLDLDTLAVLEDYLDGFGGTLVVASHDRYLLDRLVDEIVAIEPGGELTKYLDWRQYREAWESVDTSRSTTAPASRTSAQGPETSDTAAANRARQAERRRLNALESRLEKLERRREELHAELADAGADFERARRLHGELREVEAEVAEVEETWLELAVE